MDHDTPRPITTIASPTEHPIAVLRIAPREATAALFT
jgi:hypothetical protein